MTENQFDGALFGGADGAPSTKERASTTADRRERDRSSMVADAQSHVDAREDGTFEPHGKPSIESSFFAPAPTDGRRQLVERYWLNRPFAFATITREPDGQHWRYHVIEPRLDEYERHVRTDVAEQLRETLTFRDIDGDEDKEQVFDAEVDRMLSSFPELLTAEQAFKIRYFLKRDFLGFDRIDPLLYDPGIEDISCDGDDVPVFVYHREHQDLRTNLRFDGSQLNSFVVRLAQRAGATLTVSNPLADAVLEDGSRVQLTLGSDIASRGSNFTIRKFSDDPFTPVDLVRNGTFSAEQMAYLWLAIENNRSMLFAGGTGSGKTTSINAVSFFIPPDSKVVSIEDTRELQLPRENWVATANRSSSGAVSQGDIDMHQLLESSLRQRPEYLLVGEIRAQPNVALTFFQAIGTGHTAYTTIHADSAIDALTRLENPPLDIPKQMLDRLDIVSVQSQTFVDGKRVRRNEEIVEIDAAGDQFDVQPVFRRKARHDLIDRVGDSAVLDEIATTRGWDDDQLNRALEDRIEFLEYLDSRDIIGYQSVASAIREFSRSPEHVIERMRDDEYVPSVERQ